MRFIFLACNIKLNKDIEESDLTINIKHQLTKSETERFLTTLNIPTCKCSTIKQKPINTNIDDTITCISIDNNSSSSTEKKIKPISIKRIITFIEDFRKDVFQLLKKF